MVDISFGSVSQVDGKTVLTGSQSGIDTEGLIEALSTAKRLPAVLLEEDITKNTSKISALGTLDDKLNTLQSALNSLRRPSGFGTSSTDVFASRVAFQTASDGSTASNYFGVVASSGAAIKSYDIEVLNLAVAESRKSITFASNTDSIVNAAGDETSGFFSEGTFQINGVNISISEGDTLENIVSRINSKSDDTNVEASILKVSDTEYRLTLSSTETGVDNGITITDAIDSVFVGGDESDIFTTTIAGENASFSIDGDVISRDSNVFSDVVAGVTFSLFQETDDLASSPVVRVEIAKDATTISEAIVKFVDAYNDLRLFYGEQIARDDDNALLETSVLSNNSLLNTIADSILNTLANIVGISNPFSDDDGTVAPGNLTALGITFADFDGDEENGLFATTSILEVDVTVLAQKIESNFDAVQDLFGFELSSSSSNFNVFDRGTTSSSEEYTIVIDDTQILGQQASITHIDGQELAVPFYLDYDTSDPDYTAVITGTGEFANLQLLYNGDGTSTETVSEEVDSGRKDYTLSVDSIAETAQVTHVRGLELATAIDLTYKTSSTGGTVTSDADSILGEFTFLYFGDGSESIDISYSQGFADKLYNYLDEVNTGGDGAIQGIVQSEIDNINDTNDSIQESIDRIDIQVNLYTEQLLLKFTALEAAIAASDSILDLLEAQTNAANNS